MSITQPDIIGIIQSRNLYILLYISLFNYCNFYIVFASYFLFRLNRGQCLIWRSLNTVSTGEQLSMSVFKT